MPITHDTDLHLSEAAETPAQRDREMAGGEALWVDVGTWDEAATAMVSAALIVVLGTLFVDAARIPLLLLPVSFLLAAYGAGLVVERSGLGLAFDLAVYSLSVRLGVGIAVLSMVAVVSAFAGLFWVAGLVIFPLAVVGLLQLSALRGSLGLLGQVRGWRRLLPSLAGGAVVGLTWLVAWLWATVPPTFFDELSYHLVIPQRALATGSDKALPWVFFTLMPHASDLWLAWGMALGGDLGARTIVFAVWVVCSIAAWGLAEVLASAKSRVWAGPFVAAALATSSMLWFLAALPFGEAALALAMVTAMAILAARPAELRERAPWLPLGLVLGLAATVKLTGLIYVVAGVAAALVIGWSRWDITRAAGIALISVMPWWVRALVLTGNPIYPMAYELLGGEFWVEENQRRVMGDLSPGLSGLGIIGVLRLPLDLVIHPERFGPVEAGVPAIASVCLLLAAPVLLRITTVDARLRRLGDAAALSVLVAGVGWVFTATNIRFFAPTLVLGLAGVAGVLLHVGRVVQTVALAALLAAGVGGTWTFIHQHEQVFSSSGVATGREGAEVYLTRRLDHFPAARFVREQLPSDVRLLFVGETRPYYFNRDTVAPTAYDRHPLQKWVEESSSPEALPARLASEGITHVVLNVHEYKRLQESYGLLRFSGDGAAEHDQRLKQLPRALRLLFAGHGVYVYEVPGASASSLERVRRDNG